MKSPGQQSHEHHLASYFRTYLPGPRWAQIPAWPPDVFALCNLVLDQTESYRFVVSPPGGSPWPPSPDWNEQVTMAAKEWRETAGGPGGELPTLVQECWDVVTAARTLPLADLRSGAAWDVCQALLTLHAIADEACADLATADTTTGGDSFEHRAWDTLNRRGSLSHLSPARARVVPKTNLSSRGITIRSLSRYLAVCYEAVDLRWRRVDSEASGTPSRSGEWRYNVLLVPWPQEVRADDFAVVGNPLGNMDAERFGFFQFSPRHSLDVAYVRDLLDAARAEAGEVDIVVLPECALEPEELAGLEECLVEYGVTFLVAGMRVRTSTADFGRNYLHFGVHTEHGWERYDQDKHHRWCLDGKQIRQYHLSHVLDPKKLWWEAIDVGPRRLHVIDVGAGATASPLVCEDLARMDDVGDLLRRIGPSVVVAVLLDGPQLLTRWPYRYASVLADEPGSAVLTLTSSGMAVRSRPGRRRTSRVVALWNDSETGLHEIELGRGSHAALVTATMQRKVLFTADGRRHPGVPHVVLSGVRQLGLPARKVPTQRELGGTELSEESTAF